MACQGRGDWAVERPALTLEVDSPAYGAFLGDAPITVAGRVSDPTAVVWVEGREVNVGTDGSFRVQLPVGGPFRVVDVEAAAPVDEGEGVHLRERRPVFAGLDPMEAWPGALSLRIGPSGLAAIGDDLGVLIDGLVGDLFQWPTLVRLAPSDDGLQLTARLRKAWFGFDLGGSTIGLGLDEVVLGATVRPEVDADGMLALVLVSSTLELGQPTIDAFGISPLLIENLLDGLLSTFSGVLEGFLDDLLANLGSVPVGGPIAFDTDLLGTPMQLSVHDLWTDPQGIGGRLGLSFGEGTELVEIPAPGAWVGDHRADVALGVHEGLLQLLLTSELLAMLEQDLQLGGAFGNVLGIPIRNLPGGHAAPEPDAWCLTVSPGDARAARLSDGLSPLATLYLPDLKVDIGYSMGGGSCIDWLEASLELAIDVAVKSETKLDLGLRVTGGAVTSYATEGSWEEADVVAGLGALMGTLTNLLGGALDLDLAEMFGGDALGEGLPLGAIEPRILDAEPIFGPDGQPIDGLFALSLKLWD